MSVRRSRTISKILLTVGTALITGTAMADWELNLMKGVTPISQQVYDLHMLILWICVAIGVVVFGAMFISILRHRKSKGAQAAQFHHSTTLEVIWTTIPVFILVGMAIPATRTLIAMEDTSASDLTIKVTGYQWRWKYDYVDEDISFMSNLAPSSWKVVYEGDPSEVNNYLLEVDNRLVVPVDKKIRFLITSDDVIHSWWVPDLGWKKDAIPGFMNEMWTKIEEPGVYRGQCAELCGAFHGFMPVVVEAKTEEGYQQWLTEQKEMAMEHNGTTAGPEIANTLAPVPTQSVTRLPLETMADRPTLSVSSGDSEVALGQRDARL